MSRLDEPGVLSLDDADMLGHAAALGIQLERAWNASEDFEPPAAAGDATSVVIAGMGGSATAGDYFAALCAPTSAIPVMVVRGYALPNFVSEGTLVIVCSYSGNTEETLASYDDAWQRGASIVTITTGGQLAERARADSIPVIPIDYRSAPRAALAHGLAPLLRLGSRFGFCACDRQAVVGAAALHQALVENTLGEEVPAARNPAKQLAEALRGRLPIIMGAEHLYPAAVRFKNQLAENGKSLGAAEALPEADHNLVVGLGTAPEIASATALVTLESGLYDVRVRRRFEVTAEQFRDAGIPVHRIAVQGASLLQQLIAATAWGDYVSCYLALLAGIDPTPVPQIDRLKAALAAPAG
jgi:glucose/mannose-6-phosphate isomerase